MPYARTEDLPAAQQRLPPHAQDIYRAAFNNAWTEYENRADREAVAHRVAWAAVKHSYRKIGSRWVEIAAIG